MMTEAAFPLPDATQVEAQMAGLRKSERRVWWRDHAARLRQKMVEAGLQPGEAQRLVGCHRDQVQAAHAARKAQAALPPINFTEPPPLGTMHRVARRDLRLIKVRPHIRRDGQETFVLIWDSNGTLFSSGLRSKGLCKVPLDIKGVADAG